jgi:hypothetical protein
VEVTPARIRVRQTEALCAEEDAQLCGFSNEISEKTFSKNEQLKNLIREANRTLEKNHILSKNVLLEAVFALVSMWIRIWIQRFISIRIRIQ